MVGFDLISLGSGIAIGFLLGLISIMIFKRKKHDLHTIKEKIYNIGMNQHEAYKGIKKLEGIFKEMEN